jgi:serine/threonine-protein kinase
VVALKVLHPAALDDPRARHRFLREAEILARLAHPGIVAVREAGEAEGCAWIALERLEGATLADTLRRRGRLDPAAVAEIAEAAAEALAHLHRLGIVHRDVTSRNLFLLESPSEGPPVGARSWRERVRLMDFGLARPVAADGVSTTGTLAGTVAYMAPEQLRGASPDARADLYSLGVVLHEALTGRLPAAGGPVVFEPSVPPGLAAVVTRLLAPRPEDRPASAEALLAELRRRGEGTQAGAGAGAPGGGSFGATRDGEVWDGETWEAELERARRLRREGRTTEAQVALLTSAARLRETLAPLGEEERQARLRRPEVRGLLDELGR